MQKIVHIGETKIKISGVTNFGEYNDIPTPFREIDLNEYISLSGQCANYRDFRQVPWPNGPYRNLHIDWYSSYGIGLLYPSNWKLIDNKVIWKEHLIYLLLGCEHKNSVELSGEERRKAGAIGNCMHAWKCKDCGHISVVDSSD